MSHAKLPASLVTFLVVVFCNTSVSAQQDLLVDCYPLSIGNQWIYSFMAVQSEFSEDWIADTGTATYRIIGESPSADSTVWLFQEQRDLKECVHRSFSNPIDTCYEILDSLIFQMIELHSGQHQLYRPDLNTNLWNEVIPFGNGVVDSTRVVRFAHVDTGGFRSAVYGPWSNDICDKYQLTFKKNTGITKTQCSSAPCTGFGDESNHTLISSSVTFVGEKVSSHIPVVCVLNQNFPNPFNPTTTISFSLPHRSHFSLIVYNLLGMKVRTLFEGDELPGSHDVVLDGTGLASGVYYYRLRAGDYTGTRKLLLLR